MPLYDFHCPTCGEQFEARVAPSEQPPCPGCGGRATKRVFSAFAGPFTVAPRGVTAKRSNAQRRVREEQRQERRARRREQT